MIKGAIWIAVLAAGLYVSTCLGLYIFQRRLLYFFGRINAPLLIMHGSEDEVISARSSHALFDAAKEPKEYVEFRGGGHNDLFHFGALKQIQLFLGKHFGAQ